MATCSLGVRLCAVALSLAAAPAQAPGTFIVDAADGPGTHYTSLQHAVWVAPPGSTLLVRAGTYADVDLIAKSLTVICDPQVFVGTQASTVPSLRVRFLWPYQSVLVRGLQPAAGSARSIEVDSCAGSVVLDGDNYFGGKVRIVGSPRVVVRNYSFYGSPAAEVARNAAGDSYAVFDSCTITGFGNGYPEYPGDALVVGSPAGDASGVQTSRCRLQGAPGFHVLIASFPWGPLYASAAATPAVRLLSGSLRVLGQSTHTMSAGASAFPPTTPALEGAAGTTARVDPSIPMWPIASTGTTLTRPAMPSLVVYPGSLGGTTWATRTGPNVISVILVGLPGWVPPGGTQQDPIGLDLGTAVVTAFSVSAGTVTSSMQVPSDPSLRGFAYSWQAADFDPSGAVVLSNPAPVVVR